MKEMTFEKINFWGKHRVLSEFLRSQRTINFNVSMMKVLTFEKINFGGEHRILVQKFSIFSCVCVCVCVFVK